MKSISTKLFLALLSFTAVVLLATLLLARWSFDYGFSDYLNAQQQLRLNNMADDLSAHYEQNNGSWSDSTSSAYRDIYRKWFPGRADRPPPLRGRNHPPFDSFGPRSDDFRSPADGSQSVPDRARSGVDRKEQKHSKPYSGQPRQVGHGPRLHNDKQKKPFKEPIVVLNSVGGYVAGHVGVIDGKELMSASIIYQEKVVGAIKAVKKKKFTSSVESSFSKQQTKASLVIAISCLLIAGIASWWLSRMLLAPTYKMKSAIGDLVRGDFSNRLVVNRDDELGRLMLDINILSESLQENRSSRKRWIADISHELRTPVAILSGELEAVIDGIRPLNSNTIESLNHEVGRLKHLIDDLYQLSLSDIGGLRYEFNLLDVGQLLEITIGQHALRINNAGLTLNIDLGQNVIIDADASRLEQLFANLINNSVAYTDAPGQLDITLTQDTDNAVLCFSDSSPGVEVAKIEEIFEPLFRQDNSRNRRKAGAGLGLTISRNIVQGHHGSIDVEVSSLGGLEFTILLPIKRK